MRDGACVQCGRGPTRYSRSVWVAGMEAYRDPSQWVYVDRDGRQIGLCDQCFAAGRFEGLSAEEVEGFREHFPAAATDKVDT